MPSARFHWALVALSVLLIGGGALAFALTRERGERNGHEGDRAGEEQGRMDARKEAIFERRKQGGEGGREKGATNPAAEQVEERAYPRAYVDDRRAVTVRRSFDRVPARAGRSAFNSQLDYQAAAVAAPTRTWRTIGPTVPVVAKETTQFYDPATDVGTPTTNSGRVTALASDPDCTPASCRLWAAAAGGGIWRTSNALAAIPTWTPPPGDLPTNAFGSIVYVGNNTLYAGSGEPNGSGDSEAGLGLFKSTDGGAHWAQVPGSVPVATNRAISSIVVDPTNAQTIYIGTALARHGSSAVNGGRRTPPNAPTQGVYKSTDGGAHFTLLSDLSDKTPPDPTPPETGADYFVGGVNKIELDPHNHNALYVGVLGYGVWRSNNGQNNFAQVFHTLNQSDPNAGTGDFFGDRTEFDLVSRASGKTRIYLGDSSDDFAVDGDPATSGAEVWRTDDAAAIAGDPSGNYGNGGWSKLSSQVNGTRGFLAQDYCQNGQCGYDNFVVSPPGQPDSLWLGGSMNYDELPQYALAPLRSNGRGVIRSTNAASTAPDSVAWQDMTQDGQPNNGAREGMHPDMHAIAFAQNGNVAWVGSDGGVIKVDVTSTTDISGECSARGLEAPDLLDCQRLLRAVPRKLESDNIGLNDLQFQSFSVNPANPTGEVLGGTQDNGTWIWNGTPVWTESVGGDGGQSGYDPQHPIVRYHNYYSATPEVNFHGSNPKTWLDIYDTLQASGENSSFYTPFVADPRIGGRAYTGLQHVWRTDDNGGNEADLNSGGCNALHLNPDRDPCGDWQQLGGDLTGTGFGDRDGQYVVATERAPSDNGTLWAATRTGRLFVTSNADDTPGSVQFRRIDTAQTPGRFVSGIAVDPDDPNHAFVSYSGYNAYTPDTPGHVFEVRYDPGTRTAQFTDRSNNLGDQPVTAIAYNEATADVYAATDFGVLRLPFGSSSWQEAAAGMPHVAVYGLTLAHDAHTLYAATHGRGGYQLNLPGRPAVKVSGARKLEVGAKYTYTATATSTDNTPLSFLWGLPGRPSIATGPKVTFRPTKLGHQTVLLIVKDANGASRVVRIPVLVVDTKRPHVTLRKVAPTRVGKLVTIRGTVFDAGGISRAQVFFGDGTSKIVHPGRHGGVKVRHRYALAKTYRLRLTAADRSKHRSTAVRKVRVRRSRR